METPFTYGKIAEKKHFTDREQETARLIQNFKSLVNTIIISPRRWGKTSLVNQIAKEMTKDKSEFIVCRIDIFNCRTEEQFYSTYANAVLMASKNSWSGFVSNVKKYLGHFIPSVSLGDKTQNYEIKFGVDFKDKQLSVDDILDLPQKIAKDMNKKIIVCIDEFQNINDYGDAIGFQEKLRSHWQLHTDVCYCLYGSKRHMLLNIFTSQRMPFYKFGDLFFLEKIKKEDWVKFIASRFQDTGKEISKPLCGKIAEVMQNHSYYVQQLSQQVWLRTEKVCDQKIFDESLSALIDQLSLLFTNIIDSLTPRQINFLLAIAAGEINLSSQEVLTKYNLGTSSNIKNLRNAMLTRDLIDLSAKNKIVIQDPAFEYWLKNRYKR